MSKYRPIILRILAIVAVLILIVTFVAEYIEKGTIEIRATQLIKIVMTLLACGAMFLKTFFINQSSANKGEIDKVLYELTKDAFKPEEKISKKLFERGVKAFSEKDYDSSKYNFNKALSKSSNSKSGALIHAWLGRAEFEQKSYDEAKKHFENAISLDRSCEDGWYYLVEMCMSFDDYEKAISLAEDALLYCRSSHALYAKAGFCYIRTQKYERAVKYYTTAKELNPKNPVYPANLAVAYAGIGEKEKAMAAMLEAKSLNYKNYDALIKEVDRTLSRYKLSKVQYTGSFVLELGGIDEIEDCTFEDLVLALSRMWEYDYEYIILTPPAPINSVLFIQMYVVDENTALVEMSVGENGKGKLYNKKCSKQETQAIFYNFFNERKSPSIIGFRETQFK